MTVRVRGGQAEWVTVELRTSGHAAALYILKYRILNVQVLILIPNYENRKPRSLQLRGF